MRTLLRRWLQVPAALPDPALAPPWATELAVEVQKSARGQARLALRLDEIQSRLEAGLDDLRQAVRNQPVAAPTNAPDSTPLLDALDLLDDLSATVRAKGQTELAAGLERIAVRLDAQVLAAGLRRRDVRGAEPDGRLVRVVASEVRDDLPPGVVTRMVRAPVLRGTQVVREGEVIVSTLVDRNIEEASA